MDDLELPSQCDYATCLRLRFPQYPAFLRRSVLDKLGLITLLYAFRGEGWERLGL